MKFYLVLVGLVLASFGVSARSVEILSALEKEKVISIPEGQSFSTLAISDADTGTTVKEVFSDVSKLSRILPGVAFAKAYLTRDGKKILLLKVRNLKLGAGLVLEVKEGLDEAFVSAETYDVDSNELGVRNFFQAVEGGLADSLKQEIRGSSVELRSVYSEYSETGISGVMNRIVLEGPLNDISIYPGLRFTAVINLATLKGGNFSKPQALIGLDVGFRKFVPVRELGDIRGFGVDGMNLAERMTRSYLSDLRLALVNK